MNFHLLCKIHKTNINQTSFLQLLKPPSHIGAIHWHKIKANCRNQSILLQENLSSKKIFAQWTYRKGTFNSKNMQKTFIQTSPLTRPFQSLQIYSSAKKRNEVTKMVNASSQHLKSWLTKKSNFEISMSKRPQGSGSAMGISCAPD